MTATRFRIPVFSFRHLETPFDKKKPQHKNYVAVVEVNDLPDFSKWRKINVRDPKLTGSLPREIRDSFLSNLDSFVFLNRGIVLAVESVKFDNKTNELEITVNDPLLHGLLDGGHTYSIICNHRHEHREKGEKQYVKVEIIEGFGPEELVRLVDARNSSNQVKDESLMELAGDFDKIKKVVKGQPYADLIAYKEFELKEDGSPKPIDIREIVSLLMLMDRDNFDATTHPVNAYRSKVACLKHFKAHKSSFNKIYPLTVDVLKLWDTIHLKLPELYNEARGERGEVSGGKFGRLTGVSFLKGDTSSNRLFFLDTCSSYVIPAGFKYPILGAFRALLDLQGRSYRWANGIDPFELIAGGLGKSLANTIGEFALEAQNPSKTGKSQLVWQSCYQCAELAYLRLSRK